VILPRQTFLRKRQTKPGLKLKMSHAPVEIVGGGAGVPADRPRPQKPLPVRVCPRRKAPKPPRLPLRRPAAKEKRRRVVPLVAPGVVEVAAANEAALVLNP
jgi:hypothetical protein